MRIIIPMAGRGSRLRPHTLTVAKPFIPIAGKSIVERLTESLIKLADNLSVQEVCFVVKELDQESKQQLDQIAKNLGVSIRIFFQERPLGTAHALLCAKEIMQGPIIVAFADTLFRANFSLKMNEESLIWTKKVENPSDYGVVRCDKEGYITHFEEKPSKFISNLAIIGIYSFREGASLRKELEYLIDHNIKKKGEYQLTTVLENMNQKGVRFSHVQVDEWMDCGNKDATLITNTRILKLEQGNTNHINPRAVVKNSLVVPPCFVGEGALIENSKIGPYVSVGKNTKIKNSNIERSLIQEDTLITNANLCNSMIGNHATYMDISREISLGDYSVLAF